MKPLLIAATLAFASASAGHAQTADPIKTYIEGSFVTLDKNKDGRIDPAEFDTFMRARYAKQSAQFDGVITALDKDRDGKVSLDEGKVNAEFAGAFAQLNLNTDGFLSREELGAALIAAQMLS